jgi:ketosteroid isomerase-like protein
MSQENVDVVRRWHAYEGKNAVPPMRKAVERLGPDPEPEAVLALWAEDPSWGHAAPDIEWDERPGSDGQCGAWAGRSRQLWAEWVETWESYVFRCSDYRDLGNWVLAPVEVQAQGRDGMEIEMRAFEIMQVRDGKVAAYRSFLSEQEALEAAGLRE